MNGNDYVNPHQTSCPWYDLTEKFGAPNLKWCEETLCQWVSEPANTWSNILFLIVAVYFFFRWRKHSFLPIRYAGYGIFIMGLFSFVYHLSNFYPSQSLDFIGMFVCIYNLLMINIHRLKKLTKAQYVSIYTLLVSLSTLIVHIAYLNQIHFQASIFFVILAIIATEVMCIKKKRGAKNYHYYFSAFFFLIIAASFSILDLKRVMCDPTNHWLQGHALWHIFCAIMMVFIHLYYEKLWNDKKIPPFKS